MTGKKLEATTTTVVPVYQTPDAFKKSTYKAIRVDDEDDSDELIGGMRDARKRMAKLDKKESVNEYTYGVGDVVKDINPTCPHNGAVGQVKSVNPKSVVFVVMNKGKNYKPGDVLDKTHDQMIQMESINEKKNPERQKLIKDFIKSLQSTERNIRKIKQYAKSNQWKFVSRFIDDGLVYDLRDLEREADQINNMPVDINESIKVRNGETAMEGKWKVYDSHSGKTIKEVGSPRAATRLMNRLMSSGQYKEITTKWVGETVNEADDHELEMAHGQLERSIEYSQMILKKLQDGGYDELPGWVQGKLTKSMDYLQSVFNYYDGKDGLDEAIPMKAFSSSEARKHINQDIKKMSKHLGKASQQVIRIMMDGVKGGKYTAMDIARGIKEGPASRTHFGELGFIQQLWNKVRDGFRRYSKNRKLS
tara:strand:- start:355 stop:1614 length:1260 start_codon:yes stop_codon:yes gene_type:complete